MGRYLTSGPWIFQGSSSMLAGSVIGVPGPVAIMRPPCTWRPSSAVAGRYRPTLVRSSPSSGAMRTRSPTTIRRLGASSGMGDSIQPSLSGGRGGWGLTERLHPGRLGRQGDGDADHVGCLTGANPALLM